MATSAYLLAAGQSLSPRYSPRRHLWLQPGEPLVCPNGHTLKHNATITEHGALICQQKQPGQPGECGQRAYVINQPGGRRFVYFVTPAETRHLLDNAMSVDDALKYLGAA